MRIQVIDSHTGGEPTRVVIAGAPDLGPGSTAQRATQFRLHHDSFRSAVVNEPRGSDVMVGALLLPPTDPSCATAMVFFNNVGCLGMCGHGTIGVVATLAHLGRIRAGEHRLETPVGIVTATLHSTGEVTITNVPSYRKAKDVPITLPNGRVVYGDVAWGGNWFYLVEDHGLTIELAHLDRLLQLAGLIRQAVNQQGYPEVDHIELTGPGRHGPASSRNFVLCPGMAYDRSPCGTGTSAKLACLAADQLLGEGQTWIQESIIGSTFRGSYTRQGNAILPQITGRAYINAEATLILDPDDPFCWGIRA